MFGFYKLWVCVCVEFLKCGCVCVEFLKCECVCVEFLKFGCKNVWNF